MNLIINFTSEPLPHADYNLIIIIEILEGFLFLTAVIFERMIRE